MVGRKRLGDDGINLAKGGNINMMHGESRVMVVVCLRTQPGKVRISCPMCQTKSCHFNINNLEWLFLCPVTC